VAPEWDFTTLYSDIVVGRNCVAAYIEWLELNGADHGLVVEGVEEKLEAPILDGRVLLRGKVDLRMRRESDGALMVVDWKTTAEQFSVLHHRLGRSYQPVIYDLLLEKVTGESVTAAHFRVIRKVSRKQHGKPQVEDFAVPGALRARPQKRAMIERIATEMLALTQKGDEGGHDEIFYLHPGTACAWCGFKNPCVIQDEDPLAAKDMLDDLFTAHRHARYGEE
jgi:hypothetical protein